MANRLNVIAMVPYVWTNASQGVLHGIQGFQDLTLAAKWNFLDKPWTTHGALQAFCRAVRRHSDDRLQPGAAAAVHRHGQHACSWRGTLNFQSNPGWFRDQHDGLHVALSGGARPAVSSSPTASSS